MSDSDKKILAVAAMAAAANVVIHHAMNVNSMTTQAVASIASSVSENAKRKFPRTRFLRHGALHDPSKSFWQCIDEKGDDLEFLHFCSLSRESFDGLLGLCECTINTTSIEFRKGEGP